MKKRDAGKTVSSEIKKIKTIYQDTRVLKKFWDTRYTKTYHEVLESGNEIGRHGIIAEYIKRLIKRGNILDIGCGTGILAELLDMKVFYYLGLDISKEAVVKATEKLPALKSRFKNIRFEDFNTRDLYNVIVCNEVVYYMDIEILFQKCAKLLDEDGHIIVSIFDFKEGRELIPIIKEKLESPFEMTIYNKTVNLKWHLIAGKLEQ